MDDLEVQEKKRPKKTGKTKKRVNQGKQKKLLELQLEKEEEEKEALKPQPKTLQSMGGAWQTQMSNYRSNFIFYNFLLF